MPKNTARHRGRIVREKEKKRGKHLLEELHRRVSNFSSPKKPECNSKRRRSRTLWCHRSIAFLSKREDQDQDQHRSVCSFWKWHDSPFRVMSCKDATSELLPPGSIEHFNAMEQKPKQRSLLKVRSATNGHHGPR